VSTDSVYFAINHIMEPKLYQTPNRRPKHKLFVHRLVSCRDGIFRANRRDKNVPPIGWVRSLSLDDSRDIPVTSIPGQELEA